MVASEKPPWKKSTAHGIKARKAVHLRRRQFSLAEWITVWKFCSRSLGQMSWLCRSVSGVNITLSNLDRLFIQPFFELVIAWNAMCS